MMAFASQTFLFLGIIIVADTVPQGPSINRWGTNKEGGYSAILPSASIQYNWNHGGLTQKSTSLLEPAEVAAINSIVNGGATVQSSNPTTTDFKENQVGAADVNVNGKPRECLGLPSPGECRGAFPRFFYNSTLDQCDCFLYGGCGEEEGSWLTFEACSSTCKPGNTQEGPRCTLLPKQEIVTFTRPKPVVSPAPDTSHLSDAELLDSLFG